jgi:hypothetical protein
MTVTPNQVHPDEEQLVLFFYGEADGRDAIESHLATCPACEATLRELRRTLAAVDVHAIPERGPGYGADVWARLQPRLERQAAPSWFSWFAPRRLAFAGGLAVLLVAAFVAGRYSIRQPPRQAAVAPPSGARPVPAAGGPATSAGAVRDRVLLVAVGDHLERSQMVLVEMMNRPTDATVDISGTQEWARDLVPNNRLIRLTANEAGERMVADVLDDLERVLVEIANSPSKLSGAEFRQIRERVEAQGIVFKIRVLDSQVRQREQAAPARGAGTRL